MEEKKLIHIYNTVRDSDNYLKLTDNEVAFLKWLGEMGYLDEDTDFDYVDTIPIPIEF